MRTSLVLLSVIGLVGCDQSGNEFRPKVTDVPAVQDLGELPVVSTDEITQEGFQPDSTAGVYYGSLGASADPAQTGGATFTFTGTGRDVCVVLDPEAVYWTRALDNDPIDPTSYLYDDNVTDDADLDLDGGLTAYYSGSPGVEIGDFNAVYTDEQGVDHEIKFNECQQLGYQNTPNTHSGRGTAEYCTIDTDQRAGVSFTVVVKTFSLPVEDSIADFAVGVFDGNCNSQQIAPDECFFRNEYNGGTEPDYFADLESAFCGKYRKVNDYCAEHLDDEKPPCYEHIDG